MGGLRWLWERGKRLTGPPTSPDQVWLRPLLVFVVAFGLSLPMVPLLGRNLPERALRLEASSGWIIFWPFGVDLYPRWVGGRALLRGQNPYGPETEAETDLTVYGRSRWPGEPQFGFYYPAYIVALVGPLLLFPLDTAVRIWGAANLAILLSLGLVTTWRLSPRPSPIVFGLGFLSLSLFWPGFITVTVGQYSLIVVGFGALAWALLRAGRDLPAGAVLALATIKPSVSFLPVLVVLGWVAARRRFSVLAGFAGCLAALILLSSLPAGWWVDDFISALAGYQVNVGPTFVTWKPVDALRLPALLGVVGAGWLLARSVRDIFRKEDFPWAGLIGALGLNLLLTPHVGVFDLVALLIPLSWLLGRWAGSAPGFILWLGLVWFPTVLTLGIRAEGWWVWATYPLLLTVAGLAEAYRESRQGVRKV